MDTPRKRRWALAALLLVTVIWGWSFVWMKQALDAGAAVLGSHASGVVVGLFMAVRFGFSALLFPLLVPSARGPIPPDARMGALLLSGLLLSGFLLQMFGLRGIDPAVSAFLTSLYVVCTAALTLVLDRRPIGWPLMLGTLLATFGAGFIGGPPQLTFDLSEWLTVACALMFAGQIVATDRVTRKHDPILVTKAMFRWITLGSGLLLGGALLAEDAPDIGAVGGLLVEPDFLGPVLCAATLASLLALTLLNQFQRVVSPMRAAVLYALEPVWAALAALGMGLAELTPWLLVGGSALLAGNLVAELAPRFFRR